VYPLVRAYLLEQDERYLDGLWALIKSWKSQNQPNSGPHWISGQEVAIRLMALIFVACVLHAEADLDPECHATLVQMIAVHAERIPPTLIYARSQANNHLIVESVALYSAGLLFPELIGAPRWRTLGRRWLVEGLSQQIYSDGGYVQHSMNYHRLLLQAAIWGARLGEAHAEPLPAAVLARLRKATGWFGSLIDLATGSGPNLGPNDGALILPLSTCEFNDFRPTLLASSILFHNQSVCAAGPWDEWVLWLGLDVHETSLVQPIEAVRAEKPVSVPENMGLKDSVRVVHDVEHTQDFPDAGLYLMCGTRSSAVMRCAHFRNRPGHSDQLHFDLWWKGLNVVRDPGTYLYNGAPPWDNRLSGAEVHNTVILDGKEPMLRAGSFLWLDWAQGRLVGRWRSESGLLEVLAAEHTGYARYGVTIRRTVVRAGDDLWLVVDDLLGSGQHHAQIGWLLPDVHWHLDGQRVELSLTGGRLQVHIGGSVQSVGMYREGQLVDGIRSTGNEHLWGWYSPTYAIQEPALRLVGEASGRLPLRLETWWVFDEADPRELEIDWRDPGDLLGVFNEVTFQGECLEVDDAHLVDSSSLRRP
jgi:hypothetical protein